MKICADNKCTGCFACVNACAFDCISMKEDAYGELHPQIDEEHCHHCNICVKSCPNNIQRNFHYPLSCHAAWNTNSGKRKICASGGLGTAFSEYVIRELRGGVFGSRYSNDFTPVMSYSETVNELEHYKGSRYVQSIVGKDSFIQAKRFLQQGRTVLYIGTPCQIAGLRGFLHKDYENLYTVDLICHGVCPTRYFKEEVAEIKRQKGIKELSDIRFRGNDGNNFCLTFWSNKRSSNSAKRIYKGRGYEQYYLAGFLMGVSLRENCYDCDYARPERISDITIGDFIGLGKETPFKYPAQNVSSVTLNTEKGKAFYNQVLKAFPELISIERKYEERLKYKHSLVIPFPRHKLNKEFRDSYLQVGYVKAIRKTLRSSIRFNICMHYLSFWTYIYRVPRKLYRIVKKLVYSKLLS